MSKSNKKKPAFSDPKQPTRPVPTEVPLPARSAKSPVVPVAIRPLAPPVVVSDSPFPLIRYDKRLKWFLGVTVGLFLLLTLTKINGSSVALWDQYIPSGNALNRTVLYGTPKPIRMDEWVLITPFFLSQANKGFPVENHTNGGEKIAVTGTPTHHFVTLFRPNFWGFFVLDFERAYAWWWNFKVFGMLISAMFMLLILTRNNFWLSLFGSIWLLLSAGTQWWFSISHPDMFISGCTLFCCLCVFLYSQNPRVIIATALLGVMSIVTYILLLYPPYQVPFGYFLLLTAIGFILRTASWDKIRAHGYLKLACAGGGAVVLAGVLYLIYHDLESTIKVLSGTVYPGKRSEAGGTGFVGHWFVEFYSWWLSDTKFPLSWLNICELSHTLNFIPVVILSCVYLFVKERKVDYLLVILSVFLVVNLIWILNGFPLWLAKLTLYDTSPTRRTQIPFGLASVFFTIIYIDYANRRREFVNNLFAVGILLATAVVSYLVAQQVQQTSNRFFRFDQLLISSLAFVATNFLLFAGTGLRYRFHLFGALVLLYVLPNLKVNPVNKGVSAITTHPLYTKVQEIHQTDPKAGWVVIGSQYVSYLVAATGVDLLSGIKSIPDFPVLRKLDPTAKQDSAYNRYAHTVYYSYIDGTDTVRFKNNFEDGYSVGLDPCTPRLKSINVRYFIFDRQPQAVEVRCMKLVTTLGSIQIYKAES